VNSQIDLPMLQHHHRHLKKLSHIIMGLRKGPRSIKTIKNNWVNNINQTSKKRPKPQKKMLRKKPDKPSTFWASSWNNFRIKLKSWNKSL